MRHYLRSLGRALSFCVVLLLPGSAWAQMIDGIEVNRAGENAEITIRFATQVQLLRYAPPHGQLLRVFIRLVNSPTPEADLMQETTAGPKTDLVPRFTVTYPELSNGMLVAFTGDTSWQVTAGKDGRSIVVAVPALPGAKDAAAPVASLAKSEPPVSAVPAKAVIPEPVTQAKSPAIAVQEATITRKPEAAQPAAPSPAPAVAPSPAPVAQDQAKPEPAPVPAAADAAPAPPALTAAQVEGFASTFLTEARKAIADKDLARAVNRLNRTLGLPTNTQTEPAQALMGEVREMTGEIAKARAEYDLYLKLFPSGPNAARVKERLAQLPKNTPRQSQKSAVPLVAGPAEWTYYGSISQFFYTGKSQIEVITPPPPGQLTFTTDNLSLTDQKSLITSIDLNARRRDGVTDTRIVVRDTDNQNFLSRDRSYNRLYSAYVEQSDRSLGYTVRAGRQNPTGGGVLDRFDGIFAGYNMFEGWRVNGVAGIPVEFMSPYKKQFYGFSVDRLAQPEDIGFSTYYVQQQLDGVLNRRAVGLETRYFDSHGTAFGMLDYDIAYKDVNILMIQGNYRSDAGTNYFTYIDHRKTPPLSLTNILPGIPGMSIKDAINTLGLAQVRADAKALTAMSDMVAVGFTHPYSQRWLLGADYRAAKISGTEAVGEMPATPGSGLNHVISVQAIGNNLWGTNDVGVLNGSYVIGSTYSGQALGGNYVFLWGDPWRFDTALRLYLQKDDSGEKQQRISPSFKVSYHWKQVTLEGEIGAENVRITGPLRDEHSDRKYVYLGYRWDLR